MTPDPELIGRYCDQHDEAAFAELVRRHVKLVYGTALRLVGGDTPLAEDVTQAVFTDLARKANQVRGHETVAGWLHTGARFAAAKAVRAERLRRTREQEASTMHDTTTTIDDNNWAQMRPLIDEAVGRLGDLDRNSVLLRFFQEKSYREIGELMGTSEDAARMRIERALERLRGQFARRGLTASAALIASALGANAAMAPAADFSATLAQKSMVGAVVHVEAGKFSAIKILALLAGASALAATVTVSFAPWSKAVVGPERPTGVAFPSSAVKMPTAAPSLGNPLALLAPVAMAPVLASAAPVLTSVTQDASSVLDQGANRQPSSSDTNSPVQSNASSAQTQPSGNTTPATTPVTTPANTVDDGVVHFAIWGRPALHHLDRNDHAFMDSISGNYNIQPTLVDGAGVLDGKTITLVTQETGWVARVDDLSNAPDMPPVTPATVGEARPPALQKFTWFGYAAACSDGNLVAITYDKQWQLRLTPLPNRKKIAQMNGHAIICADGTLLKLHEIFDTQTGVWSPVISEGPRDQIFDAQTGIWGPVIYESRFYNGDEGSDELRGKKISAVSGDLSGGPLERVSNPTGQKDPRFLHGPLYQHDWPTQFVADEKGPLNHLYNGGVKRVALLDSCLAVKGKKIVEIMGEGNVYLLLTSDGSMAGGGGVTDDLPMAVDTGGVLAGKTVTSFTCDDILNLQDDKGIIVLGLCDDGTLAAWGGSALDPEEAVAAPVTTHYLNDETTTAQIKKLHPYLLNSLGVLAGKTVTAIARDNKHHAWNLSWDGDFLIACSDGTLAQWDGKHVPTLVNTTGMPDNITILAIGEGIVAYKTRTDSTSQNQ